MSKDKRKHPVQTPIKEDTALFAEKLDTPLDPTRVQKDMVPVPELTKAFADTGSFQPLGEVVEKVVEKILDQAILDRHNRIKSDLLTVNRVLEQVTLVGGTASMSATDYIRVTAALERINETLAEA